MPHVPGPGLHHLSCSLVVFKTSEEVFGVNIKWRQFLGEEIVSSVADDQVDDLEKSRYVLDVLWRLLPTHDANHGDDEPGQNG